MANKPHYNTIIFILIITKIYDNILYNSNQKIIHGTNSQIT